jgi:hypothetical protein
MVLFVDGSFFRENIAQVLGSDRKRWFLPVGIPQVSSFSSFERSNEIMSVTDQSFDSEGDGASFPLSSYAYDTLIEEEVVSDDERDLEQQ